MAAGRGRQKLLKRKEFSNCYLCKKVMVVYRGVRGIGRNECGRRVRVTDRLQASGHRLKAQAERRLVNCGGDLSALFPSSPTREQVKFPETTCGGAPLCRV